MTKTTGTSDSTTNSWTTVINVYLGPGKTAEEILIAALKVIAPPPREEESSK